MRNLIKVLFLPTLMYGGMLWFNRQTLYRIKNLWYKVIKISIGATFNVKTEICEIILGLPPLELFNEVNTIKHFMKLNIKKSDNDPLRDSMLSLFEFSGHSCSILQSHLSSAFKFLLELDGCDFFRPISIFRKFLGRYRYRQPIY